MTFVDNFKKFQDLDNPSVLQHSEPSRRWRTRRQIHDMPSVLSVPAPETVSISPRILHANSSASISCLAQPTTRCYRRSAGEQFSLGDRGPIVSFGFDDFPRTAYSVGGRILESFGARGTYYVAPALMHSDGPLGEICNADDILNLLEKGHELGTQTLHHLSARAALTCRFPRRCGEGNSRGRTDCRTKGQELFLSFRTRNARNKEGSRSRGLHR